MYLCNSGHDEVCYESGSCPVCEEIVKVSALEDDLSDAQSQIRELDKEKDQLQAKLNAFEERGE